MIALLANPWIAIPLAFLKKAWAFLRSLPWWVWIIAGALAFCWWWGEHRFSAGVEQNEARHRAIELKLQKRIAEEKAKSDVATARIVTRVEYRTKIVRERGATIVKEVPRYVPLDSCPLPGGFRVLHDAAAAGVLPDPARIPDAAPVPAQAVAGTVAGNYAACEETAATYCGLIEYGLAHGWPVPDHTARACADLAAR